MALTAAEAALRLNRTERTVRRWIKEGKLEAFHPTMGRADKYLIEESEVERLAQELAKFEMPAGQVPAATGEQDYASLVERVTRLEQEVQELRSLLSERATRATEPLERAVTEQSHKTYALRAIASTETPEGIPDGSILIADFAERHGVSPRTFRDQVTKGVRGVTIDTIARPKPGREKRGEVEHWLSPEQQEQVIAFWKRHGTLFEQCTVNPECRCHSLSTQAEQEEEESTS